MAHRASTCALQRFLSCALARTSPQDFHPALDLSFSTVRRQVVFGRPIFLFPSGVHVRAVTQSLSGCCLRICPMNRHLLLLTSSLNFTTLALSSSSLLVACTENELPRSTPSTFTYTHDLQLSLSHCFRRLGCFPLCIQSSHVPISYPQLCSWVDN